jgi:FixJ family two-component response regulator
MADANATVFVVDDDPSVRRSLKRLLRSSGFVVEEFASANDFLRIDPAAGPGCVILDVRMPHVTGPELFERMARNGSTLPVIFLTAHGDVPTSVRAMKDGAVDFLLKPADGNTLLAAIRSAIHRHVAGLAAARERAVVGSRLNRLSPREREVMELVVRGEPNKRIAVELRISEKTVKVHRHRVMEKMEAGSLPDLVRLAGAPPAAVRAAAPANA